MGVNAQAVQQLYVAYFNRPADVGGLIYWENVVKTTNGDTSRISAEFSKSAEYLASFANLSNAQIVNQVYLNLFGRPAEDGGITYWADLLDRHAITIDNVVTQVARGARGSDLDAYSAKVNGAIIFTDNMAPDNARYYVGAGPAQVAKDFITGITNASTLAQATQTSNLLSTFALLVSSSFDPVTSALSTGADTLVPTETTPFGGNDIFNANSSGSTQTLSALDTIDGGLGFNTLNLTSTTQAPINLGSTLHISNIQTANINSDSNATIDSRTWGGLTRLNLTSAGSTSVQTAANTALLLTDYLGSGSITVDGSSSLILTSTRSTGVGTIKVGNTSAVAGDITIHNTSDLDGNVISIKGGANIYLTQDYTNTIARNVRGGVETITGSTSTQIVNINNQGTFSANSSSLSFSQASVTVTDANFASKTQVGSINTVSINGFNNATVQDSALSTLNLSDGTGNIKIDPGVLSTAPTNQTLNLGLTGISAGIDLSSAYTKVNINVGGDRNSASFISSLQDSALTDLTISGAGLLTLTDLSGNTALKTVTVSGNGYIGANLSALDVTSVNTQSSTGTASFTIDGSKTSYTGGASYDYVVLNASQANKDISLGASADSLDISSSAIPTGTVSGGEGTDLLITTSSQLDSLIANKNTNISGFEALSIVGTINNTLTTLDAAKIGTIQSVSFSQGGAYSIKNLTNHSSVSLNGAGSSYTFSEVAHDPGKFNSFDLYLNNNTGSAISFASNGISLGNIEKAAIHMNYNNTKGPNISNDSVFLFSGSVETLILDGNRGVDLISTSTRLEYVDATNITTGGLSFTGGTGMLYVYGSPSASATNSVNISASASAVTYKGGAGSDNITVNTNANMITVGTGTDRVTINDQSSSVNIFPTILDPHAGLVISFVDSGNDTFFANKIVLTSTATLQDYADAAIFQSSPTTIVGALSWFQYNGSTYIVDNQHGGTVGFLPNADIIVKLTGLVDLSHAVVSSGGSISSLTL